MPSSKQSTEAAFWVRIAVWPACEETLQADRLSNKSRDCRRKSEGVDDRRRHRTHCVVTCCQFTAEIATAWRRTISAYQAGRGKHVTHLRIRIPAAALSSATRASCLRTCASVTRQYNLVPANRRWYSAAGEVTRAWRTVMATYSRVYGFGHLPADCRGPGSTPERTLVSSRGLPLRFTFGSSEQIERNVNSYLLKFVRSPYAYGSHNRLITNDITVLLSHEATENILFKSTNQVILLGLHKTAKLKQVSQFLLELKIPKYTDTRGKSCIWIWYSNRHIYSS